MGLLLGRGDPRDLVVIDQSCPADARKAADDKLVSAEGRRNNRRRHAAPPDGAASRKRGRTARLIRYDDYRNRLNGRPAIKAVAATWTRPKQPDGTTAALTACTVSAYRVRIHLPPAESRANQWFPSSGAQIQVKGSASAGRKEFVANFRRKARAPECDGCIFGRDGWRIVDAGMVAGTCHKLDDGRFLRTVDVIGVSEPREDPPKK
jgi:hypothetical protein